MENKMINILLRPLMVFLLSFGLFNTTLLTAQAQVISEIPYTENFSDTPGPDLPGGWAVIGSGVTVSSWSDKIAGNSLRYSSPTAAPMAITPEIHGDIDIADLFLSFEAHFATAGDSGDKVHVGFISDPEDASTFTLIETFTLDRESTTFRISLSDHETENGRRIAFKAERGGSWNSHYYGNIALTTISQAVPFAFTADVRTYHQDFNSYRASALTLPPHLSLTWDEGRTDNPFTGVGDFNTADAATSYGGFSAYTADDTDFSFGIRERAPVDLRDARLFFAFTNDTDEPISMFKVRYEVESWYIGDRRNRIRLKFDNDLDPADGRDTFEEDIFSTDNPSTTITPGTKVDGSLDENRVVVTGIVNITQIDDGTGNMFEPLQPGETGYFRWQFSNADGDGGDLRSGLAINNLSISLDDIYMAEAELLNEPLRSGSVPEDWLADEITMETGAGGYARFATGGSYLVTPVLDLSGYQDVELTFDVAKWGSGDDGPITVQVSDDGGVTWDAQDLFYSPTPTGSTYLTSGPTAITATGNQVRIMFDNQSPSQKRLRDVVLTGLKAYPAPAPVFDPAPGRYIDEVLVSIDSELSSGSIFYTTNGEEPDQTSTEYVGPITLTEDTTIKAVVFTDDDEKGPVASATYEVITGLDEYNNIADLLENVGVGDQARLVNDVIVTFVSPGFRNQHYISDETGAVLIDDSGGILTGMSRGDAITGFAFTYGEFQGTSQLVPLVDMDASSSNNDLPFWTSTLADLEYDGEPRLVLVERAIFVEEGTFARGANYGLLDQSVTSPVTFRTHLGDSDVIDKPIPQGVVNVMGILDERDEAARLFAAHYDLIEPVDTVYQVVFQVDMSLADDFNPETQNVFISGNMVGWATPGSDPVAKMEPVSEGSDIYASRPFILDGGDYAYKFFLVEDDPTWDNGEWPGDPNRTVTIADDVTLLDLYGIQPGEEPFFIVNNIAELREGETDGTLYRMDSEVLLTAQQDSRNQKWIQDATGAILIDDNPGIITTEYQIGDGITGLRGTLSVHQGVLQFVPTEDPGEATSTDNVITPFDVTLAELTAEHQSQLVRVHNVVLNTTDELFGERRNYPIADVTGTGVMRTNFVDTDIDSAAIRKYVDLVGVVGLFQNNPQIYPRELDDLTELTPDSDAFALVSPPDEFELNVAGGSNTPVFIEWEAAESVFPVIYNFHLDTLEGDFSEPLATLPSDNNGSATRLSLNFRAIDELLESLDVDVGESISLLWTVTAHIGTDYVDFAEAPFEITFVRGEIELAPYEVLFQLSAFNQNLPEWFGDAHTERGMTADQNNVYVVSRKGGAFVRVLDAQTGELTGNLNTEGVSGGTFALNDIEVSGDGRIYAGNLAIGDAAAFKLYQLHPTRAPSVVLEFAHTDNARLGDKITIVGNWNDGGLTLYAPDGNAARVFKFEMDANGNGLFGEPEIIQLDDVQAAASPVVAPLADGSFFWTASGRNVHFFEADGSHVGQIPASLAATSSTALRYLGMEGEDHLLAVYQHGHVSPDGENENIRVLRITGDDFEGAEVEFITTSMRGTANPNGTGEVAMVPQADGTVNLYVLGTNNGVGGYHAFELELEFPDYSGDIEQIAIADARALETGRVAMIKGIISSTDFGFGVADYFLQDETAGLNVTDFVEGGASKGRVVAPGDSIVILGTMSVFNEQINIGVLDYEIISRDNPLPEPVVITGEDMTADSEYQGMRIQLQNMYIIPEDLGNWPTPGNPVNAGSGVNFRITSAAGDTLIMRLARNGTPWGDDGDVQGVPLPPAIFHLNGTMGQFRQDTQVFPFFEDDFVPAYAIDWANVQWPVAGDIEEGEEYIVYARVEAGDLTDGGEADEIQGWIGINTSNVAPTEEGWTWIPADFNAGYDGSGHEYMADIAAGLEPGTYYYLSRFQLSVTVGDSTFAFAPVFGGFQNGFWDGNDNVSGQLIVSEAVGVDLADIPKEFGIDQNYPNPFNPATTIRYAVPQTAHVTIEVYNVTGQRVATLVSETRDAGYHTVTFDGTRLASGVYIYRMQAADFAKTRKLMLIK